MSTSLCLFLRAVDGGCLVAVDGSLRTTSFTRKVEGSTGLSPEPPTASLAVIADFLKLNDNLNVVLAFARSRASDAFCTSYYSAENQFERFRGFLELISRFEFEFCRCVNYFFEGFEFLVCSCECAVAFLCPRNSISNVVASAIHDDRNIHFNETVVEGRKHIHVRIHVHFHRLTLTLTHKHKHKHIHVHTHIHMHIHTYTNTRACTCAFACACARRGRVEGGEGSGVGWVGEYVWCVVCVVLCVVLCYVCVVCCVWRGLARRKNLCV